MNAHDVRALLPLLRGRYGPGLSRKSALSVGAEFEFPLLRTDGSEPPAQVLSGLLGALAQSLGWRALERDNAGNLVKARDEEYGTTVSYEFSHGTLEFSQDPMGNLWQAWRLIHRLAQVQRSLLDQELLMAPIGINPFPWAERLGPIDENYYQAVFHFLKENTPSPGKGHDRFNAFTASSQVHLDVTEDTLAPVLNLLNAVCWVRGLLFSNSPYLLGKRAEDGNLCIRDQLWEGSAFALNPRNIGGQPSAYSGLEEVLEREAEKSIFYVRRDGAPCFFRPLSLGEFFSRPMIEAKRVDARGLSPMAFRPAPEDLACFRPYNHVALTPRGTVEIRSECQQPFDSLLAPAAFHLGLVLNQAEVQEALPRLSPDQLNTLRQRATREAFQLTSPAIASVPSLVDDLLQLAHRGLSRRGLGEEAFLLPLFERLRNRTNPALDWVAAQGRGPLGWEHIQRLALSCIDLSRQQP